MNTVKTERILHLCGESICIWTLQYSDFRTDAGLKKSIKSPAYCAREFANLEWVFILTQSNDPKVYELILSCKESKNTNQSPLSLIFTFQIINKYNIVLQEKCKSLLVNGIQKQKIKNLSLYMVKLNSNIRNRLREITIVCEVKQNGKPVELMKSFDSFFLKKEFSDVIFHVKGNQYHAHKVILVAKSPVFLGMFSHQMTENISNKVEIEDFEPEVIEEFLRYLYTGKVSNWEDFTLELFAIAHKYEVDDLKNTCEHLLLKNLSVENVIDALLLANLYDSENLKKNSIAFINKNFREIRNVNAFRNLENSGLLTDIIKATTVEEEIIQEYVDLEIDCSDIAVGEKITCFWTIESYWENYESPHFQMKHVNCFSWWFKMVQQKLYLYVKKDPLATIKSFLKLKFAVQGVLNFGKVYQIDLDDDQSPYVAVVVTITGKFKEITFFWEAELVRKGDNIQISDDTQNFQEKGYEFFFRNTNCSDVTLHNEGKKFPAHKVILANKSEKFKEMFLPKEKLLFRFMQWNKIQEVKNLEMDDITSEIFLMVLKYIYSGEIENLDNSACDLYVVAKKYEIRDLKLLCENALLRNFNTKNVISTLIFAEVNNIACLKEEYIFYIANQLWNIKEQLNFESLEKSHPKLLVEILEVMHSGKRAQRIENKKAVGGIVYGIVGETVKKICLEVSAEIWSLFINYVTNTETKEVIPVNENGAVTFNFLKNRIILTWLHLATKNIRGYE